MEFLIEKVRLYPCLWDMTRKSYRDNAKKDLAWDRIAKECEMANAKEAKSQWKKLRDSHREALRRRKTITGQATPNLKSWKYEKLMSFLLPQSKNASTTSKFSNVPDNNSSNTTAIMTEESQPIPPTPGSPSRHSESSPAGTNNIKRHYGKTSQKRALKHIAELVEERDKRREQTKMDRNDIRRKALDMQRTPQDALSYLFTSFCQKTRQLPKYLQLRVEREIFKIVACAEDEALALEPVNDYYSPTTSMSSHRYSSGTHNRTSPLPENESADDTQHVNLSSSDVSAEAPPLATNTTPHEPQLECDSLLGI